MTYFWTKNEIISSTVFYVSTGHVFVLSLLEGAWTLKVPIITKKVCFLSRYSYLLNIRHTSFLGFDAHSVKHFASRPARHKKRDSSPNLEIRQLLYTFTMYGHLTRRFLKNKLLCSLDWTLAASSQHARSKSSVFCLQILLVPLHIVVDWTNFYPLDIYWSNWIFEHFFIG